jgi:hypothetical protein
MAEAIRFADAGRQASALAVPKHAAKAGCPCLPSYRQGDLAMSVSVTDRYEFTEAQNREIGSLARKMRLVGLVAAILGAVNLFLGLLLLVYAYRDQLPAEAMQRLPEDTLKQLPPPGQLWAVAMQALASGLIFLLIGLWTRSAGAEFRQIVDTAGHDIGHLMRALGSLHKMYSLLYTLIIVGILAFLVAIGVFLYARFSGNPITTQPGTPNSSAPDGAQTNNPNVPEVRTKQEGAKLSGVFMSLRDTLGEIKDPETAEAALPKLRELSDRMDGLKTSFAAMTADSKTVIAKIARDNLGALKEQVNKVKELAGSAKEKISPVLDTIVEKLTNLTA